MRANASRAGLVTLLASVSVAGLSVPASAHFSTIGFSVIEVTNSAVDYRLYLDPYHVNSFLGLDEDTDGYVTAAEVDSAEERFGDLVADGLTVTSGQERGRPQVQGVVLTQARDMDIAGVGLASDFPLVEISVEYAFRRPVTDYRIQYSLFFMKDVGDHMNFAVVRSGGKQATHVFDPLNAVVSDENAVPAVATRPSAAQLLGRAGVPAVLAGGLVLVLVSLVGRRMRSFRRRQAFPPATATGSGGDIPAP